MTMTTTNKTLIGTPVTDDELHDIAYTAGTSTDDRELLEQFDGDLEGADTSASQVYASASRSFQETRELLARVKSARGYFPVVGTGVFDGLAQPSTDRKLEESRGKCKKGKRKGKSFSQQGGQPTSLGTLSILPKPQNSRVQSRPSMSKKRPTEAGETRGGPHHAPRLRPDQCMLCRQVGHRASECPNKGKATAFSHEKRAFGTCALVCALFDSPCYGTTVEEVEQDQDEEDIKDFVAFSINSLEGFAILDGRATKTVSGFMSVQSVACRYEGTTIETTDVVFTFAGGETEAASTKICIPHAEFPQGFSANVASNESTPFLISLDVLRGYGLVIDYHFNRDYSHMKRYFLCAILPTGHLALEMLPSNSEYGKHPVASQALSAFHSQGYRRKERFHLNHPYFIFMTRSQDTSTDTLPQVRTMC